MVLNWNISGISLGILQIGLTQNERISVITIDSEVIAKNSEIASLQCVPVAMTNFRCVSPDKNRSSIEVGNSKT